MEDLWCLDDVTHINTRVTIHTSPHDHWQRKQESLKEPENKIDCTVLDKAQAGIKIKNAFSSFTYIVEYTLWN